jgi:hypothetical protein
MNYCGSSRGGGLCSFLFFDGQLERLETLLNNLLSFVDEWEAPVFFL